jgi:hypothetical protein
MKKLLFILLCLPMIGFGQWQLPAEFTAQSDPVNIMPISFTTDSTAVMSNPAGGDTLIITNWSWDFGDGGTDTVQNPIHTYSVYGNYVVCLTVLAIPTNGNFIQYTFINCDTFTYSPSGWAKMGSVPFDCTDSLGVTDVVIDNSNLTMNIAIYNGYNYILNYPYVAFTIDANGDTIQFGNMNLFGANNLVTTWYNYSISNVIFPAYPLTMYFVYSDGSLVTDTCILTYNSTPTAITDINASSNRKLISIVDVLGRESKGTRNEPLFYIYDDGTVEKQIIIE